MSIVGRTAVPAGAAAGPEPPAPAGAAGAAADATGALDAHALLTRYRLLRAAPALARAYSATPLYTSMTTAEDRGVRGLALETYALQERLSPARVQELYARWVGDAPAPLTIRAQLSLPDVRLLAAEEQRRLAAVRRRAAVPLAPSADPVYVCEGDLHAVSYTHLTLPTKA